MSSLILEFSKFKDVSFRKEIEACVNRASADLLTDYDLQVQLVWGYWYKPYAFQHERMAPDIEKMAREEADPMRKKAVEETIANKKTAFQITFINAGEGGAGRRLEIRYDDNMQNEVDATCDLIRNELEYEIKVLNFAPPRKLTNEFYQFDITVLYEEK